MAPAIPIIALIATAAGTAVAAYGAYQQGQFQKASADYQAATAAQDAQIAQQQANAQAEQDKRLTFLRIGAARASYGASGVDTAGSPLDVIGDIASQSELQRQNDLYQGNLKSRASMQTNVVESASGAAAARAGALTAGSSLLSGAAQSYSNYRVLSRNPAASSGGIGGVG